MPKKNSKLTRQHPENIQASIFRFAALEFQVGFWNLEFFWNLDVGI
jgi:hypothetical protein